MILARSPLRITLGGGGTDLPSYYREHEGFLIAGAIDKYVYITVTTPFRDGIFLKYSQLEEAEAVAGVRHPIIREALSLPGLGLPKVEITSLTDIPAGTGLGSSGSFTAALLKALHVHYRLPISTRQIAELACHIEIDRLREPVGKQDQYIASYGGLTCFTFHRDDKVTVEPLVMGEQLFFELEERLLLFFTGFSRSAAGILRDQDAKSRENDRQMLANLHYVKDLGLRSRAALEKGDLAAFALLMREHWEHKKRRSGGMSNPEIDAWHELGMRSGAAGGKLVGAGGGGFLMFLAEDAARLRRAMREAGLQEVRFRFDPEGTRTLL